MQKSRRRISDINPNLIEDPIPDIEWWNPEMIRQGLIEPLKPKVKMSNLMKVLGSEETQDPTRLEKRIRSEAAERERAYIDRNIARKLTHAERREKKEGKLFDEPNTLEAIVSVYKINGL
ncbi:hypothetical protein SO802_000282 [Lithocarpus litseifolius]|uniref:Pre-mRNA-splicing factor 3 domain-containing protein n=1 Tax=Lithocarpus litseifolius TaxID=425828 RepID=A0AAW2DUJ8_9ROSI